MPVEDHPVHPHGVRSSDHRASCFDKPRVREDCWVQDGWFPDGRRFMVRIEDTGSFGCRQILDLPECAGCTAEKDLEYINKMRNLK